MTQIKVITAVVPDQDVPRFLTRKLTPLLPYPLPLYERCQFHLKSLQEAKDLNTNSRGAEVWIAVVPTTNDTSVAGTKDWLTSWLSQSSNETADHWLAAHIDLTNPGETQVWTFGSWEPQSQTITIPIPSDQLPVHKALCQSLFTYLRSHHVPTVPSDPPLRWQSIRASGKLITVPYRRSKVLFGALSEALWPYIDNDIVNPAIEPPSNDTQAQQNSTQTCITRQDRPYLKYIISVSGSASFELRQSPLPEGFHFNNLSDVQLQLILDRSSIPRTLQTLKSLVHVGLFANSVPDPVAWGLLGKDASISGLHTEIEYRGRGLAEHVARQLIRLNNSSSTRGLDNRREVDSNDDDRVQSYAHADVSETNVASKRVFEKLGGKVGWNVGWFEVDVGEA